MQTGGRMFEVSKRQPLADIYKMIGQEIRGEYIVSFTPDKDASSEGFHKIAITLPKTNPKEIIVQAPEGYYNGE